MNLFGEEEMQRSWREDISPGACVLRQFALTRAEQLLADVRQITAQAPFRHMHTPGGLRMSAGLTASGRWGWISDNQGYRYAATDPQTGQAWPPIPDSFMQLGQQAAAAAGYPDFQPDAGLVNRYEIGARMTLHQDRNERDFRAPIVSVSLGLPAVFLFGGLSRSDKTVRIPLVHGDVAVWGGPARLRFHGILPVKPGTHPLTGECRINLTLRKAG